jgi:adenylate cyclase
MSARLQVLVYENRQLKESSEFDGPVELGRQRDREERLYARRKAALRYRDLAGRERDAEGWRWVIAGREETTVGRNQAVVEPISEGIVYIYNGSDRQPIRFVDQPELMPTTGREVALPVLMVLGSRTIRLQKLSSDRLLASLPGATIPPRTLTGQSTRFPSLVLPRSAVIGQKEIVGWLHAAMDVLQAAADSADFFERAAGAVLEMASLDAARVLLREDDEWRVQALQVSGPFDSSSLRGPSMHVLDRVCTEKKTFWEVPGTAGNPTESLRGVEAVVAAPILNRDDEVIGALYGERRRAPRGPEIGVFTEVEAMLVELLARGVAAGLARLEQERQAAQARVRFEQFFTPELARQLGARSDMLEGREREVTILFCDIRNFSRISQKLKAARAIRWCRKVLDMLSACVLAEGGVLVDYVGDGLMAMWGAPEDQPDHARRACRAALAMLEGLPALNEACHDLLAEFAEVTDVGIGINTGSAMVGNVGSEHKFKYGALGSTVNLGSRVQGVNKLLRTRALITGSTRKQLGEAFLTRRLCQARVLGIDDAVELHELLPEGRPDWGAWKAEYETALEHFEKKEFSAANRVLGNLLMQYQEDGPALMLLHRAVRCRVEGGAPPSHPVWELKEK